MSDVSENDKPEVHEELVKAVQSEDPSFAAHDPAVETAESYWFRLVDKVEQLADDVFTNLSEEARSLYEDLREKLEDVEEEDGSDEEEPEDE